MIKEKKHKHKYNWIEARIYGTKNSTGMVKICDCGKINYAIKDNGLWGATGYKVCSEGELHQDIP